MKSFESVSDYNLQSEISFELSAETDDPPEAISENKN